MKKVVLVLCLGMVFFGCGKEENNKEIIESNKIELGGRFAKDENDVFLFVFDKYVKLDEVDSDTFQNLVIAHDTPKGDFYSNYVKDKDGVYYVNSFGSVYFMNEVNIETFEILSDPNFAKDENNVYYKNAKFKNADPHTFEIVSFWEKRDKNNLYMFNEFNSHIAVFNLKETEELDGKFYKTKDKVMWESFLVQDADPETFRTLNKDYAKDKSNCYKWSQKVSMSECEKIENQNK